jgi:hypothetical protein
MLTGYVSFLIRKMPVQLHEQLKAYAELDRRTLTGEILFVLETYVRDRKGQEQREEKNL